VFNNYQDFKPNQIQLVWYFLNWEKYTKRTNTMILCRKITNALMSKGLKILGLLYPTIPQYIFLLKLHFFASSFDYFLSEINS